MVSRATLSDALIEAGLEGEAARRWAQAIEQEQGASPPQASEQKQVGFWRWRIDQKRLDRFLERGLPFLIALICIETLGVFTMLGYAIGRLWAG